MIPKPTPQEAANYIADFVNNMLCDYDGFADEMMKQHRTLQQSTMRLFLTTIKKWAEQTNYDPRNEDTINMCNRIVEALGDDNYLRFI